MKGESIRVRGLVQGVGFRPAVWRIANELALSGDVRNDGAGVLIRVWADAAAIDALCRRLVEEPPPLARIESIERVSLGDAPVGTGFRIIASDPTAVSTGIVPDAATCPACRAEILDPANRRYRYPFTNCTHCGPRLTIVRSIPYDRANTSMAGFTMCAACRAEYEDPADRRFHAQPNACPDCGPRAWIEAPTGEQIEPATLGARDAVEAASHLLAAGRVVAVKGIGGFHLACDAANEAAVAGLRRRKRRFDKPFALMARDIGVIRRYAVLERGAEALLATPAAPVVLLDRRAEGAPLASGVAPGQATLGFMLPYSPLHWLLLESWERPLVMTSGNLSDEPQCTGNADAAQRLATVADFFLLHDRPIVNRVDDSVLHVVTGEPRFVRRARGYAPAPVRLPGELGKTRPLLALGGELKNTICLAAGGRAILSQHLGDLEDARTAADYERTIDLYLGLFEHKPRALAVDLHPDYRSTRLGCVWAKREGLVLAEVQHHHAHIASVLADNGWSTDGPKVLGIALDGLGYGDDGTIWGGEFLLCDYREYRRLGAIKPAPMPGGTRSILEPWRNTWAQIHVHLGWDTFARRWHGSELHLWLADKPVATLARMVTQGVNSPLSSSCGRLFDAVAGALGLCRDSITYEGQAAMALEALALQAQATTGSYPMGIEDSGDLALLDPRPLWEDLLDDRQRGTAAPDVAMRFHRGLGDAITALAQSLCSRHGVATVALSGGVFQNRTLSGLVTAQLRTLGLQVLTHRQVPTNDGGLSLGQVAVAAARQQGSAAA